jgi:predicted nucleic acid-binding protein
MNKWVVDTCVIIDVLSGDGVFSTKSADAIDSKRAEGLVVAPITYVELAPSFLGDVVKQDMVLSGLGIEFDFVGNKRAVIAAHKAWYEHVLRKRLGELAKRPIADVLIGAYAMQKGGLITRNEADFKALYPNLTIFNPVSSAS